MIILKDSTQSIELVISEAYATSALEWTSSYVDVTDSCCGSISASECREEGSSQGNAGSNSTSDTVTIISAPSTPPDSNTTICREVEFISVYNSDTISHKIKIQSNNGAAKIIFSVTLESGFTLIYNEDSGFSIYSSTGSTPVGTETWAQVLANGKTTGGNNPTITVGDKIVTSVAGETEIFFGAGGDEFVVTTDGGIGSESTLEITPTTATVNSPYGSFVSDSSANTISSVGAVPLIFDSTIYRFAQLTASTVPYLDASKDLVSSSVTPTELGYLSGVTSSIQTQLNGKQPLNSNLTSWAAITRASGFDTFTATPTSANLASLITDETGSGALVFATSPTLVTPILGAASATSLAVTGTGGNGFLSILTQSSQPANPASGGVIYFNAASHFAIRKQSDTYERAFAFGTLAADAVYTFPNVTATMLYSGGALGTPASGTLTNCTSLPAASVNSGALANGMTATTQSAADNSTKLATTAYVDATQNNASYRNLFSGRVTQTAGNTAGTYIATGGGVSSGVATATALDLFYLTTSDLPTVNGITAKLRIRFNINVNHTAPTGNWYAALFPITSPASSGGAGVRSYTIGTEVTGSKTTTQNTPSADTQYNLVGSDFVVPADGLYAVCIVTTGTVAANSFVTMSWVLQMRND